MEMLDVLIGALTAAREQALAQSNAPAALPLERTAEASTTRG